MAETSRPWGPPVGDATKGTPWDEPLHRELWGASLSDGIIGDRTGGAALATLTATPAMRIGPLRASVRGHRYISDANKDLSIPAVSGSGNSRIDQAVLHYDPAGSTPATKITLKSVQGLAAAIPSPPDLTRAEGSGWMVPLWQWRVTTSGVYELTDLRQWVGPAIQVSGEQALPDDAPLGTTAVDLSGGRWWRELVSGSAVWVTDSARASAYLGTEITPGSGERTTRIALTTARATGGMRVIASQIVVPFTGLYRIDAQVRMSSPASAPANQITSEVRAGSSTIAASYDFVPDVTTSCDVSVSLVRSDVPLNAGTALDWFVTTSAGGGIKIADGQAFTTISVQKVG